MSAQLDFVSIQKKPNIHFEGRSISYLIECADGSKKTLGVLLPTQKPLKFKTHVSEHIEIISGHCLVKIGDESEFEDYQAGESFDVPADQYFSMMTDTVVDYVCHLKNG